MTELALNLGQILNQPVRAGGDSLSTDSLRKVPSEKTPVSQETAVQDPQDESVGQSLETKDASDFRRVLKKQLEDQKSPDSENPDKEQQPELINQGLVSPLQGRTQKPNEKNNSVAADTAEVNATQMIATNFLAQQPQNASYSSPSQDYSSPVVRSRNLNPMIKPNALVSTAMPISTDKQIATNTVNQEKTNNVDLFAPVDNNPKNKITVPQIALQNSQNKPDAQVITTPQVNTAAATSLTPTGQSENVQYQTGQAENPGRLNAATVVNLTAQNQTEQNQARMSQNPEANVIKKNTIQNLYKQPSSLLEKTDNTASPDVSESADTVHDKAVMSTKNIAYTVVQPHHPQQLMTRDVVNVNFQNESADIQTAPASGNQAVQAPSSNLFQKPIEQILTAIPTTIAGSAQQIRVSLSPEELGAVRITFRQQDEQIEGLIEIQNNEVRKDIEKSAPQIAAALAESGLTVRRIEIVPMQNSSQQQNESFSQGFSTADQQHLAGQANYHASRSSGSSLGSASVTAQQSSVTPSKEKDYDPNALNMYA
ncbi:MAG: flagellar hook-length control protein FliK [Sedimentisphaerales bacterium]|nr:flagellar hook-length control protein FliK [Sedimentisphaerales bacterium]